MTDTLGPLGQTVVYGELYGEKKLLKFTREYCVLIPPGTDTETWGGEGTLNVSLSPGTGIRLLDVSGIAC